MTRAKTKNSRFLCAHITCFSYEFTNNKLSSSKCASPHTIHRVPIQYPRFLHAGLAWMLGVLKQQQQLSKRAFCHTIDCAKTCKTTHWWCNVENFLVIFATLFPTQPSMTADRCNEIDWRILSKAVTLHIEFGSISIFICLRAGCSCHVNPIFIFSLLLFLFLCLPIYFVYFYSLISCICFPISPNGPCCIITLKYFYYYRQSSGFCCSRCCCWANIIPIPMNAYDTRILTQMALHKLLIQIKIRSGPSFQYTHSEIWYPGMLPFFLTPYYHLVLFHLFATMQWEKKGGMMVGEGGAHLVVCIKDFVVMWIWTMCTVQRKWKKNCTRFTGWFIVITTPSHIHSIHTDIFT